ncbi:tetratricopeptide repeat protein [Marinihelvus fidelis]|uniref:Tetratricopeptide repeat protein n=1 Tax=Marinihelvus fidelis TaxID=2613842 RepID=A0A5N0TGE6_9GAMM|nr:tetratricopeptide repeat protein [Marinihelvus fidelis]KAA9134120.1 tetratricopeptide repeat protein [Marinihelvus fidelis]
MDSIIEFLNWLESREGLFSALTAIAAMFGICYGIIAFFFPGVGRWMRRTFGHESGFVAGESPQTGRGKGSELPSKSRNRSSIAVLPLRTLSSLEEDRNIAAGISSEISADLSQLADLRVASHLATMQFQGQSVDLKEVAEVLSIHYALTGSFQRAGERMRLMVELCDATTGDQLWASTYDRQIKDLFDVQGEVSKSIVAAIGGQVKLADTRIAYDAPTDNLDAWGLVQKAFNFWLTHFSPQDYETSLKLLRKAVALDPQYAAARASLSMILSQRVINAVSQDPEADTRESLEMIEEAFRLGPRDLTVLENAGLVWTHHGEGLRAREALRLAVDIAPLDLMAWGYLSMNLGWTGNEAETREAVAIADRLLAMAPKHPSRPYWHYFRGSALNRLGDLEGAAKAANQALEDQPAFNIAYILLANVLALGGDLDGARAAYAASLQINPFLGPEFAIQRMKTVCMSEEAAEPMYRGLVLAGLTGKDGPEQDTATTIRA